MTATTPTLRCGTDVCRRATRGKSPTPHQFPTPIPAELRLLSEHLLQTSSSSSREPSLGVLKAEKEGSCRARPGASPCSQRWEPCSGGTPGVAPVTWPCRAEPAPCPHPCCSGSMHSLHLPSRVRSSAPGRAAPQTHQRFATLKRALLHLVSLPVLSQVRFGTQLPRFGCSSSPAVNGWEMAVGRETQRRSRGRPHLVAIAACTAGRQRLKHEPSSPSFQM